jgi:hypothetical protein
MRIPRSTRRHVVPLLDHLESRQLLSLAHHHHLHHGISRPSHTSSPTGEVQALAAISPPLGAVTGLHLVTGPNVTRSDLLATSADAPNDIWAVGFTDTAPNFIFKPLIEHFDGTSWKVVRSAALPAGASGKLLGVSALAANNVWAVGERITLNIAGDQEIFTTLIEHWDGTRWSIVASPNGVNGGVLTSVAAISADDAYAVGNTGSPGPSEGNLIEHWDGTTWSIVLSSTNRIGSFTSSGLSSVSADAANDVWAVGFNNQQVGPEVLHFDGHSWRSVPTPTKTIKFVVHGITLSETFGGSFQAVTALAPNDVWAVGSGQSLQSPFAAGTFIEHWDGTKWSFVPSPSPPASIFAGPAFLSGVAAVSATDIWAVGASPDPSTGLDRTLTEHWDGTKWSIVASPNVGTDENQLSGVTALKNGTIVAVGTAIEPTRSGANTTGIILSN